MKLTTKLIGIISICGTSIGYSQYTTPIFYNNNSRSTYNPAFAGIENGHSFNYQSSIGRFGLSHKNLIINSLNFNGKSKKLKSGYGFNISHSYFDNSHTYKSYDLANQSVHSTEKRLDFNAKINYNYQFNLGENSMFALGASVGYFLFKNESGPEIGNWYKGSVNKYSFPVFTVGLNYLYKNFFIGGSVQNFVSKRGVAFCGEFSITTGTVAEISNKVDFEPRLLINIDGPILLQNNILFFDKYSLGGGYRFDFNYEGFYVFSGLKIKQKFIMGLAYRGQGEQNEIEGYGYWANGRRVELNLSYNFVNLKPKDSKNS